MSTIMKTRMSDHQIVRFYGGEKRGICLQITATSTSMTTYQSYLESGDEGYIQLTMDEAVSLRDDLTEIIGMEED